MSTENRARPESVAPRPVLEVVQRGIDTAGLGLEPRQLQTHLDATQGARQGQVIEVPEVTDAKHAIREPAEARAEG